MKVALVLFDWFPHGGLQRDCKQIGVGLMQQGAEVDVVCMNWEGAVPEGLKRIMPSLSKRNKVAQRKAFAVFLMQHIDQENYDSVIGFNRLPGLDFYFAADTCFAWKAIRERNLLYRFAPRSRQYLEFEKAVFGPQSKTKILILSLDQKKEYLACYPEVANRLINIPPGIERNRMAGKDAAELRHSMRHEFEVADDHLLVLQVGSGFPIKGVDRSLKALSSLPESIKNKVRLFIVGRDNPLHYEKHAKQYGIGSNVTFLKSRDDLPRFFQGADLLLHPSYKESAGMVILEAIVSGLPVLTTAACGYAFHVNQADAGIVLSEPFSQQVLNKNLLAMLQSEKLKQWRDSGICYGETNNLYDMSKSVASLVVSSVREREHAN